MAGYGGDYYDLDEILATEPVSPSRTNDSGCSFCDTIPIYHILTSYNEIDLSYLN